MKTKSKKAAVDAVIHAANNLKVRPIKDSKGRTHPERVELELTSFTNLMLALMEYDDAVGKKA